MIPKLVVVLMRYLALSIVLIRTQSTPALARHDPCHALFSESFCTDSGTCFGDSGTTCDEAYVRISEGMLNPIEEPPINPVVPEQYYRLAIKASRTIRSGPPTSTLFDSDPYHRKFMNILEEFSVTFHTDLPYIMAQLPALTQLIQAANDVKINIVDKLGESNRRADARLYQSQLAQNSCTSTIHGGFRQIIEYIFSLDRADPVRRAIIAQVIPLFHTWINVHLVLALPSPFHDDLFIEFLTFASRIRSGLNLAWLVPLGPGDHGFPLVLPLLPPSDENEFPGEVLETLELEISSDPMVNLPLLVAYLDAVRLEENRDLMIDSMRSVLYYVRHHPRTSREVMNTFCAQTQYTWLFLFRTLSAEDQVGDESNLRFDLLDLFRVCGHDFFTIQERFSFVLPIVSLSAPRSTEGRHYYLPDENDNWNQTHALKILSSIPIRVLRETVYLHPPGSLDSLLRSLIPRLSTRTIQNAFNGRETSDIRFKRPTIFAGMHRLLSGIGVAIGLGLTRGQSNHIISSQIREIGAKDLYFDSRNIRKGFCRVINCVALEVLFPTNTDLVAFLDLLALLQ